MSSTPIQHDTTKLPKWAQDLIKRQNKELTELRSRLADGRHTDTNVFVQDHSLGDLGIVRDSTLLFKLEDSNDSVFEVGISERAGREVLNIRLIARAGCHHTIAVMPSGAVNVIELAASPY